MKSYLNAMRNTFNTHGRASRSEFWLFGIIVLLMSLITLTLDVMLGFAEEDVLLLTGIVSIVHLIPSFTVGVRRLHDSDKSGWWLLLSVLGIGAIVPLVFFCLGSTRGPNRFGPVPDGTAHGGADSPSQATNGAQASHVHPNAPHGAVAAPQQAQSDGNDTLAQLEKLKALRDSDAIDDAEFATLKAGLLNKAGAANDQA